MHYAWSANASLARKEWMKNYRYQGGWPALRKCWQGTKRLVTESSPLPLSTEQHPQIDVVAFSVIPKLTALWADFMLEAVLATKSRVIIGDCSGGFEPFQATSDLHTMPLLNYPHGEKLDLFMSKVCRGEFVIICDDDVFWLNPTPWHWAKRQFEANSNVAVVSLKPRSRISTVLAGKVGQPMGSYCIIIRREYWHKEQLSFAVKHLPRNLEYDWFFDTADFANVQLLERGYEIIIAPAEIQQQLVPFDGTSSWTMRIQQRLGRIQRYLTSPLRQEKAYAAIYACRGLSEILGRRYPLLSDYSLVPEKLMGRAEHICRGYLDKSQIHAIENRVAVKLGLLDIHLPEPK